MKKIIRVLYLITHSTSRRDTIFGQFLNEKNLKIKYFFVFKTSRRDYTQIVKYQIMSSLKSNFKLTMHPVVISIFGTIFKIHKFYLNDHLLLYN